MRALAVILPGLAVAISIGLAAYGYRLLRADAAEDLELEDLQVLRPEQQREARGEGPIGRAATALVPRVRRRLPNLAVAWLQRQVDFAGRPDGLSVDGILRGMLFWALLLAAPFLLFISTGNLAGLALCIAAPLIMPLARLSRLRRVRRETLDRDLPDFLDVVAVTVAAGVGFRPALMRVSDRFGGPLAEEIRLALRQVEHGASLRAAFEQLRDRSDSEALSQFVTAFLQSDELGAPLVEALTQITADVRREHAQRLRKNASQVAPRVTLVTTVFLVPATLIVLLVGLFLGSDVDFGTLFGGFEG